MDSLNSNAAAPDPRAQLRRFVDTLPWCVDFDLALTQFVRLAVEALRLGSFRVYVQNLEEDGYALRKSSADESAEGLEGDTALIRFFQNVEANCLTAGVLTFRAGPVMNCPATAQVHFSPFLPIPSDPT